ncbi:MAG: hypothetical protein MUF49_06760 [Oculatellaceae cyanobacterium Prado106]|nr:hypothetical protein [Oculatellaceae cyanobacterium Prado106]
MPNLDDLPFLKSLYWQSDTPSIGHLTQAEILSIYERNWHYRGTLAELSETERQLIRELAVEYHSWLVNDV